MLSWHEVAPGELARAQAKIDRLREQLRRAIRARNEIRKAMRVMCVATTAEGKRCCFPAIGEDFLCWHHQRVNRRMAELANRLEGFEDEGPRRHHQALPAQERRRKTSVPRMR